MKILILRVMVIMLFFSIILKVTVFANNLTLKVTTDKATYNLNDKVVVTVNWTDKMQAACYTIKYDVEKLQLESSNIADTFYNSEKLGEISINWVSMEEIDFTKMTFTFKTVKTGDANIAIKEVEAFADGNLISPNSYDFTTLGSKNIIINSTEVFEESDNTTATEIIPNAGIEKIILIIILISFICAGIGLIKYKKLSGI